MKILHLTDFHYDDKNIANQTILVDALKKDLSQSIKPDLIFFTGDLVLKGGKNGKNFAPANKDFLLEVTSLTAVTSGNSFICGGNHDVNRGEEIAAIKEYLDRFQKFEQVDYFVQNEKDKGQYDLSLANIRHYLTFQKSFYDHEKYKSDFIHDLYSVHLRTIENKQIGIVAINSAWRSFDSKLDKNNLLFPICLLLDAVERIKNCEVKILLMHHPISDFKEFISYEFEDIVYNNFNMLFSGHVHKSKLSTNIRGTDGIFCCVSPASLTVSDKESTIGYSVIDFDVDDLGQVTVERIEYNPGIQSFVKPLEKIVVPIPLGAEKDKQLKLKRSIKRRLDHTLQIADSLFVSATDNGNLKKSFLELFTPPLIKNKSKAEYSRSKLEYAKNNTPSQTIDLTSIINDQNNYLIHGQDKSGKTSLLYYINIYLLKTFNSNRILPFYIDCKKYPNESPHRFDWNRSLSRHYEVTSNHAKDLPSQFQIRILVDNYNPNDDRIATELASFINLHENISYIICTDDTLSSYYEKLSFMEKPFSHLFIQEVTRSQIRGLTQKWPTIPEEKKEQAIEKILSIFKQLRIPSNYWNVSLFLWIFEKSNSASFNNNVDLIQLYIEKLLDKENLLFNRSIKISYEQLREYLGDLAHHLLSHHGGDTYSATFADLTIFTESYKKNNIRFVIDERVLLNLILEKGILKESSEGRYSFRLNGVFEYFLAVYLETNHEFRNNAILSDHTYLSFANEFELYAGFTRKDEQFLEKIVDKTIKIYSPLIERYGDINSIDEVLISRLEKLLNVSIQRIVEINQKNIQTLSPEEKDKLLDERAGPIPTPQSEVVLKEFYSEIEVNSANLEKSLTILGRVFRNTTLRDAGASQMILDYVIQCGCQLGFFLIDEVEAADTKNTDGDADEKKIVQIWANFVPLIVQTLLQDSLAQDDLLRLLENRLVELKKSVKSNQYLLMIVYLLIIDLDPYRNIDLLDDAIEDIDLGILKNTLLVKLYTYLMFYAHGKSDFEIKIREKIRKISISIDPNTNRGELDKHIENLSRAVMIENAR